MKHIVIIGLCIALVAILLPAHCAAVMIYGYRTWQSYRGEISITGPVRVNSARPGSLMLLSEDSHLGNCYASIYLDYKWYGLTTLHYADDVPDGWCEFDMLTGERRFITRGEEAEALLDLTYDYTTGTAYGLSRDGSRLMRLDVNTGATVTLHHITNRGMAVSMRALAADLDGQLWAVGTGDMLYRVSPRDGQVQAVGFLDVAIEASASLTFDHTERILYWTNNGDDRHLYTIDTATGHATMLGELGSVGYDCINAITIPYINAPAEAPDRVTDRRGASQGYDVTLRWTDPTTTVRGERLADFDGVKVYRDGHLCATVAAGVGEYRDVRLALGTYTYRLVPYNDAGDGGVDRDNIVVAVGYDVAAAPDVVEACGVDGGAEISWSMPDRGAHGGMFDPAAILEYRVVRSNQWIDTVISVDRKSLSMIDCPSVPGEYRYSVSAVVPQGIGVAASTATVMVKPASWVMMTDGTVELETGRSYEFYDTGGPDRRYLAGCRRCLTVRPSDPESRVAVRFDMLDTESDYDILTIFDGEDMHAPVVARLSGCNAPSETYEATNEAGALTFLFDSDASNTANGWRGELACDAVPAIDLAIALFEVPQVMRIGQSASVTAVVANRGKAIVHGSDYELMLYADDMTGEDSGRTLLATVPGADDIEAGKEIEIAMWYTPRRLWEFHHLVVELRCNGDECRSNDVSLPQHTVVINPDGMVHRTTGGDVALQTVPMAMMATASISRTVYNDIPSEAEGQYLSMIAWQATSQRRVDSGNVEVWVGCGDDMQLYYSGEAPIIEPGSWAWEIRPTYPYVYRGDSMTVTVNRWGDDSDSGVSFAGTVVDGEPPTRYMTNFARPEVGRFDAGESIDYTLRAVPDVMLIFTSDPSIVEAAVVDSMSLSADGLAIKVTGVDGVLTVTDLLGRVVAQGQSRGATTLMVPAAGIYLVATDIGHVVKVLVAGR